MRVAMNRILRDMSQATFTKCAGGASSYELLNPYVLGTTIKYPCSGAESHAGYCLRNLVAHSP